MPEAPYKILVVDDEVSITEFVQYNLKKEGYEVTVAHDGATALELFAAGDFSLVLLDIMMPDINGYEVCKKLRLTSQVPVMFLSARDTEIDKVVGLEIGGDDYLTKPFGVRELTARVKALLRRSSFEGTSEDTNTISVAGITLDQSAHHASSASGPIDLTPREFELLNCLMQRSGKVLSREQLLRDAWGWEYLVETKTVDTHVKRLRDKLESAGLDPNVIETVRGYGYRFKADS
ncbi:MAG: response regulator transcription factor [Coriobacteriia bacterium]|nr:response regulator transcription factor [Coriobacteriia bacterium]MCL2537534.1 response regulator transcription factor [Coriobacteriia bacterium]